ncbi:tRNA pseudouridine synthase D [Exidia glandulosa HHB12029]|uniref:tRNA pseudouridine synthase D n=1 Tax=Exidia glandulosa HHB12029 TaxID=1314781 RepID=A0A165QU72_EXIGL|nr:tRNA pseudouridine synthase D [Exidia glandulosa HHB12029]
MASNPREHDDDADERPTKRVRVDDNDDETPMVVTVAEDVLPPSSALLNLVRDDPNRVSEVDVGISQYISKDVPRIEGIIKQRFTDFLVFEVNQAGEVIHLKDISKPVEPKEDKPVPEPAPAPPPAEVPAVVDLSADGQWHTEFDDALSPYLSASLLQELRTIYEEGSEPPFVADGGWGQRPARATDGDGEPAPEPPAEPEPEAQEPKGGRNQRGRGRGRGGKNPRGPAKQQRRPDTRKVISDSIEAKADRGALHKAIRELFNGKLESETMTSNAEAASGDESRIVIRWKHGQGRWDNRKPKKEGPKRKLYVHFTMHKTNRDTHDALSHLARMMKLQVRDFGVAGTKDKRGVTTQRVSVRAQGRSPEILWKLANNVPGRRTEAQATSMRGERGIRVGDFCPADTSLDLGMLQGNAFVITLRNVKVDSEDIIDRAMGSMKTQGFINYYGMQRFGTASVPTHSIGLALLQSDWQKAVSLILSRRPGEHPDVDAGRRAWLDEGDLDKALQLLPRRVVAERCILENFKKQGGETRNCMGALSTIPRNLRTMYVHAYQSYVWNAVVSERIRRFGADKAVPGDIVFADVASAQAGDTDLAMDVEIDATQDAPEEVAADAAPEQQKRGKKKFTPVAVKVLTEEDASQYSIFDVVMPLPGRDVAYPGGELGEMYKKFLIMDGLDPMNLTRIHNKEYSLLGSYRKMVQLPRELSWSVLHYTDPDVALAQSDEDQHLGFDAPAPVPDGKFLALQIRLTLTTAAYATMALREVTKAGTSSHYQTQLTKGSEDQAFRGTAADEQDEEQEGEAGATEA